MPEHRYYPNAKLKALLWPIGLTFLLLAAYGVFYAGAKEFSAYSLPLRMVLFVLVLYGLGQVVIACFGAHIILREQALKGLLIRQIGLTKQSALSITLPYNDVEKVREGVFLHLPYKRYYSRKNPYNSIVVFCDVDNAQECFNLIDERIKNSHA